MASEKIAPRGGWVKGLKLGAQPVKCWGIWRLSTLPWTWLKLLTRIFPAVNSVIGGNEDVGFEDVTVDLESELCEAGILKLSKLFCWSSNPCCKSPLLALLGNDKDVFSFANLTTPYLSGDCATFLFHGWTAFFLPALFLSMFCEASFVRLWLPVLWRKAAYTSTDLVFKATTIKWIQSLAFWYQTQVSSQVIFPDAEHVTTWGLPPEYDSTRKESSQLKLFIITSSAKIALPVSMEPVMMLSGIFGRELLNKYCSFSVDLAFFTSFLWIMEIWCTSSRYGRLVFNYWLA